MIVRRRDEVERVDVAKRLGHPEGSVMIQWIISNEVGDERYGHRYAVRRYYRQPQPDLTLDDIPFHHHKYVQSPIILSGRMVYENGDGEKAELGPGDTVYFYENEPHRSVVIGDEPVDMFCIIDCPEGGKECDPDKP